MAALVIIIDMDKKNYKKIEKLIYARTRHGTGLTIPSCRECDGISRKRKKKDWSKNGLASVKWAQRKSHSLLTEASPKQVGPVSMGCCRCAEFGQFAKACPAKPKSLKCDS